MDEAKVWVFIGSQDSKTSAFPGGVFSTQERAESWIAMHNLSGTLTLYRLDVGAYDWAVQNGYFRPTKPNQVTPEFIASFSGGDIHFHYEHGTREG
jgi:hypothetical protein